MSRPTSHSGLSSPGIYYLLSPFPPVWSRGEVGSAPRSRGKRQEGRVGGEGWAICTPGPTNGSSSIYLHGQKPRSSEMPQPQSQPKPDGRPQTLACSSHLHSSPLQVAGSSGEQWEAVGHTPIRPCLQFLGLP